MASAREGLIYTEDAQREIAALRDGGMTLSKIQERKFARNDGRQSHPCSDAIRIAHRRFGTRKPPSPTAGKVPEMPAPAAIFAAARETYSGDVSESWGIYLSLLAGHSERVVARQLEGPSATSSEIERAVSLVRQRNADFCMSRVGNPCVAADMNNARRGKLSTCISEDPARAIMRRARELAKCMFAAAFVLFVASCSRVTVRFEDGTEVRAQEYGDGLRVVRETPDGTETISVEKRKAE